MSFYDESEGIGGETAGDGNPFSVPESEFAGDDTGDMTAGQRVGLDSGLGAASEDTENAYVAASPKSDDSDNAAAPEHSRGEAVPDKSSVQDSSGGGSRAANVQPLTDASAEGQNSSPSAGLDDAPAYQNPAAAADSAGRGKQKSVAGNPALPGALGRVVDRGEQIGSGLNPITGKPDAKRKHWSDSEKSAAWEKAKRLPGEDASQVRQDMLGRTIHHDAYGKKGEHGWEVDHRDALSRGGDNQPANLEALHSKTNNKKSDRVAMRFGDKWTFQNTPKPQMSQQEFKEHDKFLQALNSDQIGRK